MEKIILPVIRNKFPTSMKGKLLTTESIPDCTKIVKYKPIQQRLAVKGGLIHSFIEGWIEIPYSLVREEFQEPIDNNLEEFHLVYTKTLEILESGLSKEEYELVKDDWNKRIEDFAEKQRGIK